MIKVGRLVAVLLALAAALLPLSCASADAAPVPDPELANLDRQELSLQSRPLDDFFSR